MGIKMRQLLTFILLGLSFLFGMQAFAQQIVIDIEGMNPTRRGAMGITTSYSTGLNNVGKGEHVYLSAYDFSGGAVTSVTWEFLSRPVGSTTVFEAVNDSITKFLADVVGQYKIKATVVAATGTGDAEVDITAANYTGVEMTTGSMNCATCHSGIRDEWIDSRHATLLKRGLDGEVPGYSATRLRTSTTGIMMDNLQNGSFGSLMASTGWQFPTTLQPGNWDAMKTSHPNLARVGTIGCESCHGAGSQHPMSGPSAMTVQYTADNCLSCHHNLPNVRPGAQWESSGHGNAVWSNSFRNRAGNNALSDCVRCHDGRAYVNFTNGIGTNTHQDVYSRREHVNISCQSCHDPHKGGLRTSPAGSDTLSNGYSYASFNAGEGRTCMDCHKYRANGNTLVNANLTAQWGPHYGGITDVLLGKNGYTFGNEIPSSVAHQFIENSCVGCHMAQPATEHRNKMGEHTFKMSYVDDSSVKHDLVQPCVSCHSGITKFSDIVAAQDYDGDGQTKSFIEEFEGLFTQLKMALPPVGEPTVDWQQMDNTNITQKGAYYNYRYINYEKSKGMHNPKYIIGLLQTTVQVLTGVEFEPLADNPVSFELKQNYPNPFNPTTKISFIIPQEVMVKLEVYSINGQLVETLVNEQLQSGSYSYTFNANDLASGVYFYRLTAGSFVTTNKMVLMR